MHLTILAFAQAQQQLGFRECQVECAALESPRAVLARIAPRFDAKGMRVAVDSEYHDWDAPIGAAARELALIPPVSGG